jgi:protein phosphatase PTC2/3
VIRDEKFPGDPKQALRNGFAAAEKKYLEMCYGGNKDLKDKSGSCALVVLIVGSTCFIANVGDS